MFVYYAASDGRFIPDKDINLPGAAGRGGGAGKTLFSLPAAEAKSKFHKITLLKWKEYFTQKQNNAENLISRDTWCF